ncbi:hypothetical protein [Phaeobacter sp.]|uniref:hypothetical protein n=1 Tax=Phaeobacter sp. TaxID=1902409 RepID=UPI0025FF0515|nr:hypothetical protein [Phaeobacter sp.]
MISRSSLSDVQLLASGALPDRPNPRPLLFSCDMSDAPVDDPCRSARLEAWHRLQTKRDQIAAVTHLFQGEGPLAELHAQRLRHDWQRLCAEADTPLLIYLHCGHQPDTRSPILQHLLHTLGHQGPVHALRVECRKSLRDAWILARALTVRSELSLVLRDPTERLSTRSEVCRPLRYALLGTRDRAAALAARQMPHSGTMSGTFAATPFRSL